MRRLVLAGVLIAGGMFGAGAANASCTVNVGHCGSTGNCTVNVGTCDNGGQCMISVIHCGDGDTRIVGL
ncbi:MAG: hypothetical protein QOC82_3144 [Frankiaceae bacterium]|jgi:hypothetical protein|nr:hypothetical protein [Frankiaceae bacterium]